MRRLRVAVIFGGRPTEAADALRSAASVLRGLDPERYEPVPAWISAEGEWTVGEAALGALRSKTSNAGPTVPVDAVSSAGRQNAARRVLLPAVLTEVDVAFPLVRGPWREDGTLQGLLDAAGLPYVGPGVLAAALGMDKPAQKVLCESAGVPSVERFVVTRQEWTADPEAIRARVTRECGWPCFVKPASLESSVGVGKARSPEEVPAVMADALSWEPRALVERAVSGREVSVGILGTHVPRASVPGEVALETEWYDYEAKHTPGLVRFEIPALLSDDQARRARAWALCAFGAIGGTGLARVDFFLERDRLWLNEINVFPVLGRDSLYPGLWGASGLAYRALLDRLIALALERHAGGDSRTAQGGPCR